MMGGFLRRLMMDEKDTNTPLKGFYNAQL